jgi:hypothetical protein
VSDHLYNLFVEEWSTEINYFKYFDECAPSFCTYTAIDQTNFYDASALFISLFGGLVIIFRLIAPFLVNVGFKLKYRSRNTNIDYGTC